MYGHSRQKDFVWGALIGGTVAVLTSLLFTTKKGKQLQRKIADTYEDLEENVKEKFSDVKEKTEEEVDHLQKKIAPKSKHDDHHKDSK